MGLSTANGKVKRSGRSDNRSGILKDSFHDLRMREKRTYMMSGVILARTGSEDFPLGLYNHDQGYEDELDPGSSASVAAGASVSPVVLRQRVLFTCCQFGTL